MAPRENYFFYILNEVKWLFDSYGPSDKLDAYDEMWFEFNKTPLKWYAHCPLHLKECAYWSAV